ncbi:sulfite exporter TauE/SafE family protein [Methylocystis sp.]|uniref:sulfite exporter TauE/SafE family protein n=1 Tax=Methylocystis sp. TaxID=1911079 RepID=UPI0039648B62
MKFVGLALLGILAGALSGLTGIGGGVIIVPALVYIFHYSVHSAQGTTLALLVPPIGAFAAWTYYKHGYVDIKSATIIAVSFAIGAFVGADIAVMLPERAVRRIFAVVLLVVATEMFLT